MLISEIKNKEVRERAEYYARTMPYIDPRVLSKAFIWESTAENILFWTAVENGEDVELPKIVHIDTALPNLPAGWKYTGAYRQAEHGEFFMYQGEVKQARGQKGWYHIVVRAEA